MPAKRDVQQGTLDLMILKTIDLLGPLHGYGIARRIEDISRQQLAVNYGTLYPALLKLEQEGCIKGEWGVSENNRQAKLYNLTPSGKRQLVRETRHWQQTTAILACFVTPTEKRA
jgi:PadR family transcriptional regulator, regulatory protein PadR